MNKKIPSWADKEKLKEGQEAEERACNLFMRMFDGITVERYPWNSIVDARIMHKEDIVGYIEIKSHKRGIGASSMNDRYNGLYKLKSKQYDFSEKVWKSKKVKTIFMVEFNSEWYYIDGLHRVNVINRVYEDWINKDGEKIRTDYVLFDHGAFLPFPTTSGGYLSNT